ncbi:unnamed protein product [Mycena citricolor]|uniref:SMP-LTD domain-containing protein n=1 Tax=Mycena citricolor TaxID=2018698 RepID=A0AAD2GW17_9AGAR|nr:unnamed protein product [Mycena citricolor]
MLSRLYASTSSPAEPSDRDVLGDRRIFLDTETYRLVFAVPDLTWGRVARIVEQAVNPMYKGLYGIFEHDMEEVAQLFADLELQAKERFAGNRAAMILSRACGVQNTWSRFDRPKLDVDVDVTWHQQQRPQSTDSCTHWMSLQSLFYAYILGGFTFLPLVIAGVVYYSIYTAVPVGDLDARKKLRGELAQRVREEDPDPAPAAAAAALDTNDMPKTRKGWLTMRRTFEESSLDGSYVTLVRSLLDARSKDPKKSRPKDMWYVVLKGKILYLYEDEAMTECEAAIELGSHEVTISPEGLLDGELFAKRNAICLRPKGQGAEKSGMPSVTKEMQLEGIDVEGKIAEADLGPRKAEKERDVLEEENKAKDAAREEALDAATPWFIFVRDNVLMEDWYLALVHASDHPPQTPLLAPLQPVFQVTDMNHLVNTLDEQPDVIPMRWFNALLGRVLFSHYRTQNLEDFILSRLMKKLSKVKRPTFLTDIVVTEVSVGNKAPTFSKPMLKELTKEGDASLEVHVLHKGEFRITVEATATINLGSRFKPYTVKLVLAVVLKEIEGNLLVKVKRPPSNRIWYAFTQTPRMVLEVEPIVSDRQITWSMITSTLESSIKSVIQESVVMPNMDDVAFFDSLPYSHRGGIWADAARRDKPASSMSEQPDDEDGSTTSGPEVGLRETQSAAELTHEPIATPPDTAETHSLTEVSSSRPTKRKSWFSTTRSEGMPNVEEVDDVTRGRSVEVDKNQTQRSRSTPNAPSDSTASVDSGEEPHLRPLSQPIRGHSKSNSVDEFTDSSSASVASGSSPMSSSLLSTLKSRDKQAISNTAKETIRKWSANWSGLMKDKDNRPEHEEMPDHGLFGSRSMTDMSNMVSHKARQSYAEVRAAVAERRGRGRDPSPVPSIPEPRDRAATLQPNGTETVSTNSIARAATDEGTAKKPSPSPSRLSTLELPPAETGSPSPIFVQPQAMMMTIPGIHASHRGQVMSMGYVAPDPTPPTPDTRVRTPAISSVYRLWKNPASDPPSASEEAAAALAPRPTPPPLPPRSRRTTSVSNVLRPEADAPQLSNAETAQPSASEALQSIADKDKDKRASRELVGNGFPPPSTSPSSRRSTLSSADDQPVGVANPGPPLPPRRPQ